MKNSKITLLLIPTLMLVACNTKSKSDVVNDIVGDKEVPFTLTMEDGDGGSIVEELSKGEGGVSISLTATSYVDGDMVCKDVVTLSRVNNIEWGTLAHTNYIYLDDILDSEETFNYGGAIKFLDASNFEVYYVDPDDGKYVYYGEAYDTEIDFSFEELEEYLTLDNTYLAAAVALGDAGKYETIAGRKCLTFSIPGTSVNLPEGRLEVSFDLQSRLLMKCHAQYIDRSGGDPVLYTSNIDVGAFTTAGAVPELVKE